MTTAEKIYRTARELPEPMLHELLDFAELLKKKKEATSSPQENIAHSIQRRFKGLDAENLPIPSRQLSRTPPQFEH
ncbi:MAG: DUF2281 domain-containing protein [Chlorobiaceae bacterium]|nr:DUF2281 domain-containing protein [Chlorobiaceae bacterium]